jgi:hypothetical protein
MFVVICAVFATLCSLFWLKNTTELTMSSTKFNIKDAAKLYGMSRNTVYKALQEGRLSKNAEGMLEFVELLRVFGEPATKHTKDTGENSVENTVAQEETQQEQAFILESKSQALSYAQREIDSLRVQLEDAKLREGFYQSQLQSLAETVKKLEPPKAEDKKESANTLEETGIIQRPSHIAKYGVHYVIALLIVIIITISCYAIFITR